MEDLRKDVHAIHLKQDAIAKVVTGVQAAISVLNQQLATMADVLKSFVIQSIQCVWPYISMLPSSKFDWATAMKFLKFLFRSIISSSVLIQMHPPVIDTKYCSSTA